MGLYWWFTGNYVAENIKISMKTLTFQIYIDAAQFGVSNNSVDCLTLLMAIKFVIISVSYIKITII